MDAKKFHTQNYYKHVLIAKIKGLADQGIQLRQHFLKHRGNVLAMQQYSLYTREVSRQARLHLLAYGFLRGKPYRLLESNSQFSSREEKLFFSRTISQIVDQHTSFGIKGDFSEEKILAWLEVL